MKDELQMSVRYRRDIWETYLGHLCCFGRVTSRSFFLSHFLPLDFNDRTSDETSLKISGRSRGDSSALTWIAVYRWTRAVAWFRIVRHAALHAMCTLILGIGRHLSSLLSSSSSSRHRLIADIYIYMCMTLCISRLFTKINRILPHHLDFCQLHC